MYKWISNLKSKVYKLDIGTLKTIPVDLNKLSAVVKNEIVKKTEYNKLLKKLTLLRLRILKNLLWHKNLKKKKHWNWKNK